MKQAVILAGGKGTRLRSCLGDLPKALVNVCGKPLIEWQMNLLKRYGYTHVLLLVNYGKKYLLDYCKRQKNWGIDVQCIDDGLPRGTAGAVLSVMAYLDDAFLVVYGDTMLNVDLARFLSFYQAKPKYSAGVLYLHPNDHPHDSDLVEVDGGRIVAFHPYPHQEGAHHANLVNAALYYLRRDALRAVTHEGVMCDFGKDLFPKMIHNGEVLWGYLGADYIKDCGTPKRLEKVTADILSGRVESMSLSMQQKAVFLDRDGVINKEVGHLSKSEEFELLSGVEVAIQQLNASLYRTIVVTNQPVVARGDCSFDELAKIHKKMESQLGNSGAYLDRIYICPHHPDAGFKNEVTPLKIKCDCRKPDVGMINAAVSDLNIDLNQSWLIGDTTTDMLAAKKAGLRSILVETGHGGMDGRYVVAPDFTAPDLKAAVNFILEDYPRIISDCDSLSDMVQKGQFVFIGGLSRSGKTTFARCLKHSLCLKGKNALILDLDSWLCDIQDRGSHVMQRYHVEEVSAILRRLDDYLDPSFYNSHRLMMFRDLCEGSMAFSEMLGTGDPLSDVSIKIDSKHLPLVIELPVYNSLARCRTEFVKKMVISPDDVILVEGTIALLLRQAVSHRPSHSYFVELDETVRRKRILKKYHLQGVSDDEAEKIYEVRQLDESTSILKATKDITKKIQLNIGSDE